MIMHYFGYEEWERDYIKESKALSEAKIEVSFFDHPLNKDHLPQDCNAEIISVFVDSKVDARVIAAYSNLKFIATRSTGFDHIDLLAAAERGIVVSNVPGYGANTVAEHAFALLLSLSKRIYDGYDRLREEGVFSPDGLRGFDLLGKTLGVIGTGRIGKHSITIAKGFGMNVIAYDPYPDKAVAQALSFSYAPLPELLQKSDIVTIHVPYMESTHHLINEEAIQSMKSGAYLINTSRGGVLETEALVKGLQSGHIAGAGLDVLEEEGIIKDELQFLVSGHPEEHNLKTMLANHVLIDHPRVIVTPHSAFNTVEALKRILDATLGNIGGFVEGSPANVVGGAAGA